MNSQAHIHLTSAAHARMRSYLAADPQALGVRLGVKRTGCSGWGYVVEIAHERTDGDHRIDHEGLTLLIDAESWPLVAGTEVDFISEGLNHKFAFRNPNAAAECGCGESFTVEAV
ncbi:MAG TPA: iron-sulfur cluster assembly accessory protein [Xanthomonadaceae bacterium]|nr:iron-sulfur cluster assembly accessory protein [Xanthomonadaceae bacterium]